MVEFYKACGEIVTDLISGAFMLGVTLVLGGVVVVTVATLVLFIVGGGF